MKILIIYDSTGKTSDIISLGVFNFKDEQDFLNKHPANQDETISEDELSDLYSLLKNAKSDEIIESNYYLHIRI